MTNVSDPVLAALLDLPYSRGATGRPKSSTRIWLENNRAYIPPLIHKRGLGWKAIAQHLNANGYTTVAGAPLTPQSLMEMWRRVKTADLPDPVPDFVFPEIPEPPQAEKQEDATPEDVTAAGGALAEKIRIEDVAKGERPQILRIIRK